MDIFARIAQMDNPVDYEEYANRCIEDGEEPLNRMSFSTMVGNYLVAVHSFPADNLPGAMRRFMRNEAPSSTPMEDCPQHKSRGLGDTIEKITTATGIKRLARLYTEVTGKDCGCEGRRDKLNEMFPYKDA